MDTAQTEKLKALALAATPGEWTAENHERQNDDCEYWRIESEYGTVCGDEGIWWPPVEGSNEGNAKWIAAACPTTVLSLIAEVERLRSDAGRYRAWRKCVQTENQAFINAVSDALPSEDSDATFTDEQWDRAIDAAIEKEKA